MSDTDTLYPSTEFDAEFNGCGAMSADFSGDLKIHVDDLPRTLGKIHALGRKKFKVMLMSDQAAIPEGEGGNGAGEWANMDLQADDEREVEYKRFCVGGECGHFCVPKEGDLANQFVCYLDPDALMVIVQNETLCPLYVQGEGEQTCAVCAKDDCVLRLEQPESGMGCGGHGFVAIGAQVDESAGGGEESPAEGEAQAEDDAA